MCMVVYIASDLPLRTWPFDPANPGFHVTEVEPEAVNVKRTSRSLSCTTPAPTRAAAADFNTAVSIPISNVIQFNWPRRMHVVRQSRRSFARRLGDRQRSRCTHAGRETRACRRRNGVRSPRRSFQTALPSGSF